MNIAVYGAGALGTVIGAYISKAGVEIDLISRNREHVTALKRNGAKITGTVNFTVPVNALTPDKIEKKYELVFLMTKSLHNETVLRGLVPFITPDCIICSLQTGIPEPSIAAVVGKDRVMGCAVGWGAVQRAPGVVELTSEPDGMTFVMCRMNGQCDDKLLEVKKLLEYVCPGNVEIENDYLGMRWARLIVYCAFSGMSSILKCSYGDVIDNKFAEFCAQHIIKECIEVANAAGIKIGKIQGNDIVKSFYFTNEFQRMRIHKILAYELNKHRLPMANMVRDLQRGRKSEIDALNGVVCDYGLRYNVKTPYNDLVTDIIHEIENGTLEMGMQNLEKFKAIK